MKIFLKVNSLLVIIFFITVLILMVLNKLTFGYGLGDIKYFIYIILWLIIIVFVFVFFSYKRFKNYLFYFLLIIPVMYLSVYVTVKKVTVDRGSAYKWNGKLFKNSKTQNLKEQEKDFQNELSHLDSLINLNPLDYVNITNKGILLRQNGQITQSIIEYGKAQKINPIYYDAFFECGYSYGLLKDYKMMKFYYKKAHNIDSTKKELSNFK